MRVIFLDIDGVLNGHDWRPRSQSNTIRRRCILSLNRIIKATDAKIVLSSAWRYMIHCGAMTTSGFDYLLRTHGTIGARVIDVTCTDEEIAKRGKQISCWLWGRRDIESFVVIDDCWYGGPRWIKRRWVQTDGARGMTPEDAARAIAVLQRRWRPGLQATERD